MSLSMPPNSSPSKKASITSQAAGAGFRLLAISRRIATPAALSSAPGYDSSVS